MRCPTAFSTVFFRLSIDKNQQQHNTDHNLIIFHLLGQHVKYNQRFPSDHRHFKAEDYEKKRADLDGKQRNVLADYDNAVLYNDSIVDAIISRFEDKEAIAKTKQFVTEKGIGRVKVNYRLRDAIFSRQRYWGEPFPVYYKQGMPYMIPEECLPLELPEIDKPKPLHDPMVVRRFLLVHTCRFQAVREANTPLVSYKAFPACNRLGMVHPSNADVRR